MEALRRARAAARKAVRGAAFWAPLAAALLGGAPSSRAASTAHLNIHVHVQGIGAISDLAAVPGTSTGTISLSWTEPYRSAGVAPYTYDVRVSSVGQIPNDAAFVAASPLSAFSTSVPPAPGAGGGAAGFVVTDLTPDVTYYFAIREKDSTTFFGAWSRAFGANPNNFAVATSSRPAAPAGGAAVDVFLSSITAAWTVSPGATGYVLIASPSPGGSPVAASSATASSTATLSGLGLDTTYYLFASACLTGCSPFVSLGSTVTLAAPAAGLAVGTVSTGAVSLSWSGGANPADTLYAVQSSTDGASYALAASTAGVFADVGGLSAAATYYFRVIALNRGGTPSAPSAAVSTVTLSNAPAPPAGGGTAQVFASSLTATWALSSSATSYVLAVSSVPGVPPSVPVAASSATAASTATLTGLAPDTTYYLSVAACGDGCSPFAALGSTSTLAVPAVGLSTTSISSSTVGLAWGSGGNPAHTVYAVQLSLDGVSYADAETASSPAAVVTGLTGGTTYYLRVVAVNAAGTRASPSAPLQVTTPSGPTPSAPTGLSAAAGLKRASVSWTALPAGQQGSGLGYYRLLRSTNAGFGYVQVTTTAATSFLDKPLASGVTVYYRLVARDVAGAESAPSSVASATPFGAPPMEPIGLTVTPSSSTILLSWTPTTRFFDGTPFENPSAPAADELQGYELYRATDACAPVFVRVTTAAPAVTTLSDVTGGLNYYYRLQSFNSVGASTVPVTVSSLGERNFFDEFCASKLVLDDATAESLNASGGDIRIVTDQRPQDLGNGVFQSVEWRPMLNGVSEVKGYVLPKPARVVLRYGSGSGAGTSAAAAPAAAADLGMYWFNGVQFVKMYGRVDAGEQTVTVDSPNLGVYQVRALGRSAGAVFDVSNLASRVITPNGDGLNDTLIFTYDPGPNGVQPQGRIFDLRGATVAEMVPGLVPNTLTWNGHMNGMPVRSGAYVYRITGDGKTFTGTIVVAR